MMDTPVKNVPLFWADGRVTRMTTPLLPTVVVVEQDNYDHTLFADLDAGAGSTGPAFKTTSFRLGRVAISPHTGLSYSVDSDVYVEAGWYPTSSEIAERIFNAGVDNIGRDGDDR